VYPGEVAPMTLLAHLSTATLRVDGMSHIKKTGMPHPSMTSRSLLAREASAQDATLILSPSVDRHSRRPGRLRTIGRVQRGAWDVQLSQPRNLGTLTLMMGIAKLSVHGMTGATALLEACTPVATAAQFAAHGFSSAEAAFIRLFAGGFRR